MDPQFITPFIKSIQNVFSTMMQLQVNVGDPRLKTEPLPAYDVSGIIGMSGDVVGSIVLSFTTDTATCQASSTLNVTSTLCQIDASVNTHTLSADSSAMHWVGPPGSAPQAPCW